MLRSLLKSTLAIPIAAGAFALMASGTALAAPVAGATLSASKTVDICSVGDTGLWRYSGAVSIWNDGAVATQGLAIYDCIQNKDSGPKFTDNYCAYLTQGGWSPSQVSSRKQTPRCSIIRSMRPR